MPPNLFYYGRGIVIGLKDSISQTIPVTKAQSPRKRISILTQANQVAPTISNQMASRIELSDMFFSFN